MKRSRLNFQEFLPMQGQTYNFPRLASSAKERKLTGKVD